jgi:hypothetical protein
MATGITLVKRMSYKALSDEETSTTYWFDGTTPANATEWSALFDALVTAEKAAVPTPVRYIRGYGYDDGDPDATAVWVRDLLTDGTAVTGGTLSTTGAVIAPGDSAVWVRWRTSRLNSKGKPIYLRKWLRPALRASAESNPDIVLPAQVTALNALGAKLRDGTFLDGRRLTSASHASETLTAHGASPYITVRQLRKGRRRPPA